MITEGDVEKVAWLAHLRLTEDEKRGLARQLDEILRYAERIQSVDTEGVEPTSHALLRDEALRDDLEGDCLPPDDALAAAPEVEAGLFTVPKVIG
jgi:aspartyl-tRNA(Asn)/glutamyl-tRNA(Gln) amidotransferase subunit C